MLKGGLLAPFLSDPLPEVSCQYRKVPPRGLSFSDSCTRPCMHASAAVAQRWSLGQSAKCLMERRACTWRVSTPRTSRARGDDEKLPVDMLGSSGGGAVPPRRAFPLGLPPTSQPSLWRRCRRGDLDSLAADLTRLGSHAPARQLLWWVCRCSLWSSGTGTALTRGCGLRLAVSLQRPG